MFIFMEMEGEPDFDPKDNLREIIKLSNRMKEILIQLDGYVYKENEKWEYVLNDNISYEERIKLNEELLSINTKIDYLNKEIQLNASRDITKTKILINQKDSNNKKGFGNLVSRVLGKSKEEKYIEK